MIAVRAAEATDAEGIAALMRVVHTQHVEALPDVFAATDSGPRTPADVVELIAQAGPLFKVAEYDGAFAGYARAISRIEPATAFKRASRVLHVDEMAVDVLHRRRGVGRALLSAMRVEAVSLEMTGLSLDVYSFNSTARDFYTAAGFAPLREWLTVGTTDFRG